MSKDWTPKELHLADNYIYEQKGEYLHDSTMVWHYGANEEAFVEKLARLVDDICQTYDPHEYDNNLVGTREDNVAELKKNILDCNIDHIKEGLEEIRGEYAVIFDGLSDGELKDETKHNLDMVDEAVGKIDSYVTEHKLYNADARRVYPNLSFLCNGFEMVVYPTIMDNKAKQTVYGKAEWVLSRLCLVADGNDGAVKELEDFKNKSLSNQELAECCGKFFEGKLCEGYYQDENHNAFKDELERMAKDEAVREKLPYETEHSPIEKATELMETLNYTLYPPKHLFRNGGGLMYDTQTLLRNVVENKISMSIPYTKSEQYLVFGHICENPHGSDSAVYGGAIENAKGEKLGDFLYHGRTGRVDYFSMKDIERQRTTPHEYFNIALVATKVMSPQVYERHCRDVMGLSNIRLADYGTIRPLNEDEIERLAEVYSDKGYYIPNEEEKEGLLVQTMSHEYVSPAYMSDLEQSLTDMKETVAELKKEKAKAEDDMGIYERKRPYC